MRWMSRALAPALRIAVVRSRRMGYGADIGASGLVSARAKPVVTARPRKAAVIEEAAPVAFAVKDLVGYD